MIASERRKIDLRSIVGHDDPAIATVTAMELLAGIERAAPAQRDEEALKIEGYLAVLVDAPYTLDVARLHALLHNHVHRIGRPRGAHDLIIAATAAATGRTLLTTDAAAEFDKLPGVKAEVVKIG